MRFIIDGTHYDADDIGEVSGRDMMAMSKQAKMGIQTWQRTLQQVTRLALADDGETVIVLTPEQAAASPERCDPNLVTESEPHLRAFLIMVWLARRLTDSPTLSFDEASALPFRKIEIDTTPDEEPEPVEEAPDPSLPSAGAPVADGVTPTSTPSSTD